MPLKHDAEYKKELDAVVKLSESQSSAYWLTNVVGTFFIIGGFLGFAFWWGMADRYLVPITVLLATYCLVNAITGGVRSLHVAIMCNLAAVEWTGRKQLAWIAGAAGGGE